MLQHHFFIFLHYSTTISSLHYLRHLFAFHRIYPLVCFLILQTAYHDFSKLHTYTYIFIAQNFLFLFSISKRSVRVALEDHSGAESMRAQGPSYGADINCRTRGSQPFPRNPIALDLESIISVTNALYLHIVNAHTRTFIGAYITVLRLVVFYFDSPFLFSHSLNQFHFFCFTAHIFLNAMITVSMYTALFAQFFCPVPQPPYFSLSKPPVHIRYFFSCSTSVCAPIKTFYFGHFRRRHALQKKVHKGISQKLKLSFYFSPLKIFHYFCIFFAIHSQMLGGGEWYNFCLDKIGRGGLTTSPPSLLPNSGDSQIWTPKFIRLSAR